MLAKLHQLFSVDLRSLALFRVLLALAILLDIAILWPDIDVFLSDSGLYPRRSAMGSTFSWSLYFINGSVVFSHLLLLLNAVAAILLLVGYRTRWVTVICWVFAVSLDSRITALTSGADTYLRLLLFWSMFLPLGARHSVDEAMNKQNPASSLYFSWAVVAMFIQVTCLYLFSALLKTGTHWQETYDAIYLSLNSPEITTPLALYVASYVAMLRGLTFCVYYLELFAVVFLFTPIWTAQARLLIVTMLALMHLGFALFLSIGFFPLICIAGLMVFVPSLFWDRLLPRRRQNIRIYYDEGCGFCRKTCLIFRALGMPSATEVLPAQQTPEIKEILEREYSWVVEDEKGERRLRWDAVAWCWRRSAILWPLGVLFAIPPINLLGDRFYRFIANNRGDFGRLSALLLPETDKNLAPPLPLTMSYLMGGLAMVVVAWNSATLHGRPQQVFPEFISNAVQLAGLRQKMNFFAPQPISRTRWVVVEGELADGRKVDLLFEQDRIPSHALAAHGFDVNPGYRWRKFLSTINFERNRNVLGRYFCMRYGDWKKPAMAALKAVDIIVYRQNTPMPGAGKEEAQKLLGLRYDCSERKAVITYKPNKTNDSKQEAAKPARELDPYIDSILREPGADQ